MSPRLLVVADDLTGASDTGSRFAERGYDTSILTATVDHDAEVLVRDTDSRYLSAPEAAKRVHRTITEYDPPVVYKKIDSTLRGNIAAELTAAIEAVDPQLTVMAPAFPETGRTTTDGCQYVHGTPVHETSVGSDLETAHIPTLLSDSNYPIDELSESVIRAGVSSISDRMTHFQQSAHPRIIVADATTSRHLAAIARAAATLENPPLYVGSGGLAGYVRLGKTVPVLGVAGSVASETLAQLTALPDQRLVRVDGAELITETETISAAVSEVIETLEQEGTAVLTAATHDDDVARTFEAGRTAGLTESDIREAVSSRLARIVRSVLEAQSIGGLFMTGGAIANATLSALDGDAIELAGQSIASGIPLGRIASGPHTGLPVVTKAGAFGEEHTIDACLEFLSGYNV